MPVPHYPGPTRAAWTPPRPVSPEPAPPARTPDGPPRSGVLVWVALAALALCLLFTTLVLLNRG